MYKKYIPLLALLFLPLFLLFLPKEDPRAAYEDFLKQHPYNQNHLTAQQVDAMDKYDRPDLAAHQDFLATMDPQLMRPTPETLFPIMESIKSNNANFKTTADTWTERGPNNVGGRTRSIFFDPNDVTGKKVWAAGVAGGVWYNNDITQAATQWQKVNDFWSNLAVSCMTYDPSNTQIFYAGTGEGWYNTDAVRGAGIWKSTNGGSTWTQLTSTSSTADFYYIQDIDVHPLTGDIYACTNSAGVQKSTNGGATWTRVLTGNATSLSINAYGKIWVAIRGNGIYTSQTGNLNDWNFKTSNNGFPTNNIARIELAIAPSDSGYCYAMVASNNQIGGIYKTTNSGSSWISVNEPNDDDNGIPPNDFSRGQAWYDLSMAVDPNNAETLVVGAIDLFKSTNGGNNWEQLSHWFGGYGYQEVHADQHKAVYKPGSSSEILFANDGGVYYSNEMNSVNAFEIGILARNNGYNVTQFYAAAAHPTSGQDYYLAGAQDNGTQQFTQAGINSTNEVTGGDGAFCFIDQTNPNYQISSYVYNSYRFSKNGGNSFKNISNEQNTGSFINPTDYDDVQDVLFSHRKNTSIKRIFIDGTNSPFSDYISVNLYSSATALKVSPYTTSSSKLYVGTAAGRLFQITNANSANYSDIEIGSNAFPNGSISSIEFGLTEDQILVTFSNYGIPSVWYTNDGGSSWTEKEGNLPNMPVRWGMINPQNGNHVILATELGVWSTYNFSASAPQWNNITSNSGLSNTVVSMLQYRPSDQQVIAATHGRGLFTSNIFNDPNPRAAFTIAPKSLCINQAAKTDNLSSNAVSYLWTVTPKTFKFINQTDATSQNPEFEFLSNGVYTIELAVTNTLGTDTHTETIDVGGFQLPFIEDFSGSNFDKNWTTNNPDQKTTWQKESINGNITASLNNFTYYEADSLGTQIDDLISPPFDFSAHSYVHLNFKYAYTTSLTNSDSLGVFVSENCGDNWYKLVVYKENGNGNYITTFPRSSSFAPYSPATWCGFTSNTPGCKFIDLSMLAGKNNIKIMFRNYGNNGNNIYLDDINITSSGIGINENNSATPFKIYPNPASQYFNINFNQNLAQQAKVTLFDLQGRVVKEMHFNNIKNQELIRVNTSNLATGSYIVQVKTSLFIDRQTLVIQ